MSGIQFESESKQNLSSLDSTGSQSTTYPMDIQVETQKKKKHLQSEVI